jgi:hypothetical protein
MNHRQWPPLFFLMNSIWATSAALKAASHRALCLSSADDIFSEIFSSAFSHEVMLTGMLPSAYLMDESKA